MIKNTFQSSHNRHLQS